MNYIVCIPSEDQISRENCEKIHNILARMSDKYRLNIVPEPVKTKRIPSPPYYRKYRIYKEIRERDGRLVMATFHPAALLRNPSYKPMMEEDLRKLAEIIAEEQNAQIL